ncbi:hypothetical protein [Streptomyces eurythermus]
MEPGGDSWDEFRRWIGERGARPGTRVTLLDEETGGVLADWPDQ